jgi:hypothetical protein
MRRSAFVWQKILLRRPRNFIRRSIEEIMNLLTELSIDLHSISRWITCLSDDYESVKTAALLMMDLDNLKKVNDTYGHGSEMNISGRPQKDWLENQSGRCNYCQGIRDEFIAFVYGYDSEDEIRKIINNGWKVLRDSYIFVRRRNNIL